MHWIVATLGLTETLVLILVGLVWFVYAIWTRRKNPPRGFWRWGAWIPLGYCIYGTANGLREHWRFYQLMMAAEAFNEPQAELFWENATWGAIKLLTVGCLGTLFIRFSMRKDTQVGEQQPRTSQPQHTG